MIIRPLDISGTVDNDGLDCTHVLGSGILFTLLKMCWFYSTSRTVDCSNPR